MRTLCASLASAVLLAASFHPAPALAQTSPAAGVWSGWLQCRIAIRGPQYQSDHVQTWKLDGAAPKRVTGAFHIHTATWSVTGQGAQLMPFAPGRRFSFAATGMDRDVALFVRASDNRMIVRLEGNTALVGSNAGESTYQASEAGRAPPPNAKFNVSEWLWPWIEGASPPAARMQGTKEFPVNELLESGSGGNPGSLQGTATCVWDFAQGTGASSAPSDGGGPATTQMSTLPPARDVNTSTGPGRATPPAISRAEPPAATTPAAEPVTPATPAAPVANDRTRAARPVPQLQGANAGAPPAAPLSGVYRVTLNGLVVGTATNDTRVAGFTTGGIGDPDGRGDEAYGSAYVRRFDRTSFQLLETKVSQTLPYGDITNFSTGRLRAGTQTPTGGLQRGDKVPDNMSAARTFPAGDSAFPLRVFEGRLTDGADVLLVAPMVWEYDGVNGTYNQWLQSQQVLNNTIMQDAEIQARLANGQFGTVIAGSTSPTTGPFTLLETMLAGGNDAPIGAVPNGSGAYTMPNTTVVLTREIIEKALSSPYVPIMPTSAPGVILDVKAPGVLVLNFTRGAPGYPPTAQYTMAVQVEKISD